METVYFYCSIIGGGILALQVIMVLIGFSDTDADLDGDLDMDGGAEAHADAADAFFKVLTFKTLVAFVTFFGLSGMASTRGGVSAVPTLMISVASGSAALYIVAWLMAGLSKLQSSGNVDLRNSIGSAAKVYLSIPGNHQGRGKVTVAVQGRTVEAKAVTAGKELKTGSMVRIVGVPADDTLEVVSLDEGAN
ncbi:MAG: hypothetical protein V2A76_02400 [Planctomycetota bacterium]